MGDLNRFRDQVRRNAVALISLVIAITSLGYNSWRNEHSENNRNQRFASFELLLKLGELQELIYLNHYDCDATLRGNARSGWVMIQTIQDLTLVFEDSVPESAQVLKQVWGMHSKKLDFGSLQECEHPDRKRDGLAAVEAISPAIAAVREDVLGILYSLD